MLLHGFEEQHNIFGFWEAANISTFGPKQESSFPVRNLPAPPTHVAGIQTRPNQVCSEGQVAIGQCFSEGPQPRTLITMQIPGPSPKLESASADGVISDEDTPNSR